jgi:hypothetical protein
LRGARIHILPSDLRDHRGGGTCTVERMGEVGPDERNRSTTERLRALAQRLSDEELTRALDPAWTSSALFAHIAFWDRFVLARWKLAVTSGSRAPDPMDDTPQDLINDAALPGWKAIPPRAAVETCLAAAEELDRFIGSLDTDIVARLVRDRRERLVDRSLHRGEHLGTLESAFGDRWIGERAAQSRSMSRWSTETRWPRSRK